MTDPAPTLPQLAGSTAHALNNVLSVLFAAASHLEAAGESRAVARARAALDDACGGAQALSAALSLLALGEADVAAALHRGGRPDVWQPDDWRDLAENLRAVAAVAWEGDAPSTPVALPVPREVIESLLACAAVSLKRSAPAGSAQRCRLELPPASPGGALALALSLWVDRAPAAGGAASKPSPHPCVDALAHAAAILAPLGVAIDSRPGERVRVTVRLAPAN